MTFEENVREVFEACNDIGTSASKVKSFCADLLSAIAMNGIGVSMDEQQADDRYDALKSELTTLVDALRAHIKEVV